MRSFAKINPREIVKTLCPYLMKVNHIEVANFYVANMPLTLLAKIKFSRKFPNLQYYVLHAILDRGNH